MASRKGKMIVESKVTFCLNLFENSKNKLQFLKPTTICFLIP